MTNKLKVLDLFAGIGGFSLGLERANKPGSWFSRILADLASIGYDAEWENIPASAVGAPHRRERVWIVAYSPKVRNAGEIFLQNHKKVMLNLSQEHLCYRPILLGWSRLQTTTLYALAMGFPNSWASLTDTEMP